MSETEDTEKRRPQLSPVKQALLEKRLRGERVEINNRRIVARPNEHSPIPLSFAQQRLWILSQLTPDSPFYNIPAAVRLCGRLDVRALELTFNEIIRRHEALRTTFSTVDGQPVQVIAQPPTLSLQVEDLCVGTENEREERARQLARAEALLPFDLNVGPLLRLRLLKLGEDAHVVLFTMHHIISDRWSIVVLVREVATLYEAYATGQTPLLAELPVQYADFAVWQRRWFSGEVLQQQLSYWKKQLGGTLPVLELRGDKPRPTVQTYRGANHNLALSQTLSDELKSLGSQEGATLFMMLLAAFQVLLHRYSGQEDILVGSPIANRKRIEIEPLIGFFVNTLVLRTLLSGDPTFRETLGRVKEATLGAYAHQDMPFEKLVEELQPERNPSRSPIFQVWFTFDNVPRVELEVSGVKLSGLEVENMTAKFELALLVGETAGSLGCLFEYNTDLFEATTMAHMAGHFEMLLLHIVKKPETRLSELKHILDEDEKRRMIVDEQEYENAIQHQLKNIKRKSVSRTKVMEGKKHEPS